jgi:hypothetical protein
MEHGTHCNLNNEPRGSVKASWPGEHLYSQEPDVLNTYATAGEGGLLQHRVPDSCGFDAGQLHWHLEEPLRLLLNVQMTSKSEGEG